MQYIKFESPLFLLLAIFLIIALWRYDRKRGVMTRSSIMHFLSIGLILVGISDPQLLIKTAGRSILFVIDISDSVSSDKMKNVQEYIRAKSEEKNRDDRIGVMIFAEDASLVLPLSNQQQQISKIGKLNLPELSGIKRSFTDIEGAVSLASRIFPEELSKKIVLVSDGNENKGKISDLFHDLNLKQIPVDVLPVGGFDHEEIILGSLHAPSRVSAGTPFMVETLISSNFDTEAELTIYIDGQRDPVIKEKISVGPDVHQTFRFPLTIAEGGYHTISAYMNAEGDRLSVNNSAETYIFASGRPHVLMINNNLTSSAKPSKRHLGQMLLRNNIQTEFMTPQQLPSGPSAYSRYDAVILNDLPSTSLTSKQMHALTSAVHDLGTGIVMVGGMHSLGPQSFAGSEVESALPVQIGPSSGKRPSSIDLVLVMDKSGSMSEGDGESKIELAIESTQSIDELFSKNEQAGIIAFDSEPHIIAVPGSMVNRSEIISKIQGIVPRGSTDFYPALVQAYDWLKNSDAVYKHIILLSDGKTRERNYNELLRNIQEHNISVSVIGIGRDSNIPLMKEIARKGQGRFFQIENDLRELSEIFRIDTMMASRKSYIEETFSPRLNDPDPITDGIPIMLPVMHGYMVTSPKKAASVPVSSHKGDPIIAYWQYGLGKASIFTGDDGARWTRDWISWDAFGRLWVQLVKRCMRTGTNRDNALSFIVQGNSVEMNLEVHDEPAMIAQNVSARILNPDETASDLRLFRSASGSYSGAVDNLIPGRYLVTASIDRSGNTNEFSKGAFRINGNEEFLTLNRNDTLLKNIASNTKGRVLNAKDRIFDDDQDDVMEHLSVWPYLFMLAVVCFLIEVATGRGIISFLTN